MPGPDGGLGNNRGDRAHPSEHPRGPGPVQNGQNGHPQHPQRLGPAVLTSHPVIVALAARVCQCAVGAERLPLLAAALDDYLAGNRPVQTP